MPWIKAHCLTGNCSIIDSSSKTDFLPYFFWFANSVVGEFHDMQTHKTETLSDSKLEGMHRQDHEWIVSGVGLITTKG